MKIKKMLAIILSMVMLICALPMSALTANAATNPYPNYNYYNSASDYQIACTWYAWKQVYEKQGIALPAWGNARSWYGNASNAGYSVGSSPKAGAIACWSSGTYGHVAYVTGVNSNGSFNIIEGGSGWPQADAHGICSRTVSQGPYWPEQGFIYPSSTSTTPSVTFNAWSHSSYTFINDTNAAIGQEILISNGNCTKTGMYLYDSNQTFIASAENPSYTLAKVFFNINTELKTTLRHATKYHYKFYAVVNGTTYWSNMNSFTTTGSHSYTTTGYDSAHPHKVYKKCACGAYNYTGETKTISSCSSCRYVASILISKLPNKTTYYIGDKFDASGLLLSLKYNDGSIEHHSSYSSISGFDSSTAGTKTITVYYGDLSANFTVAVKKPTIKIFDTKLNIGDNKTLTVETDMPANTTISWSSDDTSIATVSNGIVKAKAVGKVNITATITINSKKYSDTCTVEITSIYKKGWKQSSGKWWYQYSDGSYSIGWDKIDNVWYYFDKSGWMQTGWVRSGNAWYYLKSNGALATGWLKQGKIWYYLNNDGAMQTGWEKVDNTWYYFKSSGAMQTGWQKIGGEWYYLESSGAMHIGWLKQNNAWYYLDDDGSMVTGIKEINGKYYGFDSNGVWIV